MAGSPRREYERGERTCGGDGGPAGRYEISIRRPATRDLWFTTAPGTLDIGDGAAVERAIDVLCRKAVRIHVIGADGVQVPQASQPGIAAADEDPVKLTVVPRDALGGTIALDRLWQDHTRGRPPPISPGFLSARRSRSPCNVARRDRSRAR
jgi:hypothetical protein